MNKEVLDPDKVLVIHDFLSREECTALNHCYQLSLKAMVLSGSTNGGAFIVIAQGRLSSLIEMGRTYGWRAGRKVK